ncbi:SHOCT domain-containing protein [Flammeovirgaceae bacterium SG7u.111]|nr:SHOCT domain-containing protein [Flammeovirgaceae bacterium SG7u.132]WPO33008.1 SHOCT domain-containing protein [Flammeovirgaceae bacterium SG7u.111]
MNARFTDVSIQNLTNIANRYGVSSGAAQDLAHALMMSGGSMAQFNIPELGGGGQWMQGGMTMVGDMFNNNLKAVVDGLCIDISNLINQGAVQYVPLPKPKQHQGQQGGQYGGNWWGDLGFPNSTGSQNGMNYAIFNQISRLAIQLNGKVTIYDTLDHQIGGVGQQQGGGYSVSFTSQYGNVDLNSLPIVSGEDNRPKPQRDPAPQNNQAQQPSQVETNSDLEEDIFVKIEKLAGLKNKGILSAEEFDSKKAELLGRL